MNASRKDDLNLSRGNADLEASYLRISGPRLQGFGLGLGLYSAIDSQFASSGLLSSEQFGYGGRRYGRAYDSSEFTADNGVEGIVELRYSGLPTVGRFSAILFAAADAGRLWDKGNAWIALTAKTVSVGLRYFVGSHVSGQLIPALPINRPVSAPGYGSGYDPRCFLSMAYRF